MPSWIPKAAILAIYSDLIKEHGGRAEVTNKGALESTLARPHNLETYKNPSDPSIFELAASYGFGFAMNHCFSDGNKRMALVSIDIFLEMNGYELIADELETVETIRMLASGDMSEEQLGDWIQANAAKFKLE